MFAALFVASTLFVGVGGAVSAASYEFSSQAVERSLIVIANQTKVLEFATDVGQAIVGDPATADVLPVSARTLYIQGKKFGTTNLTVFSSDRTQQILFAVQVTPDIAALKRSFADIAPGVDVKITPSAGRLILTGTVPDAVVAERLALVAKDFAENVTNAMVVDANQQVMLEVWFLEVSRNASKSLGVNLGLNGGRFTGNSNPNGAEVLGTTAAWTGVLSSGGNLSANIEALESEGVARRLANPNLVALSGKEAYFNSGGRIAYPVTNANGSTNVQLVPYGVNMTFLPTVVEGNVINLEVKAEVSSVDTSIAKEISESGGFPSLIERVAKTSVELRSGEALMIAGLTDADLQRSKGQTPGVGEIPLLGALFRSSSYTNKEAELVIIIMPRTVAAGSSLRSFQSPLNKRRLTDETEFFANGVLERNRQAAPIPSPGASKAKAGAGAGHMMDDAGE
jgi:pilus assembly protein CpaC